MSLKSLIPVGAVAVIALAVFLGGGLKSNPLAVNHAEAKSKVQDVIQKLSQVSDDDKAFLNHSVGGDLGKILQNAYDANDLAYQETEQESYSGGKPSTRLVEDFIFTDSQKQQTQIHVEIDKDSNFIVAAGISYPNMTIEQWLKRGAQQLEQEREKQRSDEQNRYYNRDLMTSQGNDWILEQAKTAKDLTYVGDDKDYYGKTIKKYTFTDKYSRKVAYSIDEDYGIIRSSQISNQPKGSSVVDKTTGLTTYTNPYGYQITFPSQWFTFDASQGATYALSEYYVNPIATDYNTPGYMFTIDVYDGNIDSAISKWSDADKQRLESVTFNGYQSKSIGMDGSTTYFIEQGGKTFGVRFDYNPAYASYGVSQQDGEKILATFKLK